MSERPTPETESVMNHLFATDWRPGVIMDAFCDHARKLERQRDELLEALRQIARNPGNCDEHGYVSGHIARAAIARVKGGGA